ncbi:hypothetical protein FIBSPDRAFT_942753 [Athelia psychrophila]|uniref:Uncharacterized protein n=1 Tax=Athelia psychrophila TaxID=1759441 RepID=A0A166XCY4_9AGAM|nr:hypothetical protein FIBSPDRAFT_942753 [Fibularhizoctonia sp. CBS 109695]
MSIMHGLSAIFTGVRQELQQAWAETSHHMQTLRDNPAAAKEEFGLVHSAHSSAHLPPPPESHDYLRTGASIGKSIWARVFTAAGFDGVDLHVGQS